MPRLRRVRPRRTLSVTYANRDPIRLAAADPPSLDPLAHTWRGCTALRARLKPIRHGVLPDPLPAVEIISTVAGRLPPSSERPARPKFLASPRLISKRPSRTPPRGLVVWESLSVRYAETENGKCSPKSIAYVRGGQVGIGYTGSTLILPPEAPTYWRETRLQSGTVGAPAQSVISYQYLRHELRYRIRVDDVDSPLRHLSGRSHKGCAVSPECQEQ